VAAAELAWPLAPGFVGFVVAKQEAVLVHAEPPGKLHVGSLAHLTVSFELDPAKIEPLVCLQVAPNVRFYATGNEVICGDGNCTIDNALERLFVPFRAREKARGECPALRCPRRR